MSSVRDAKLLYQFGHFLARFCFRTFAHLDIVGSECVPRFGPLIVVSNHLSLNDPPLLVAAIPRPLFFVGKKELFNNPISRFLFHTFNVSPLNRSSAGIDAVRVLMQNLERAMGGPTIKEIVRKAMTDPVTGWMYYTDKLMAKKSSVQKAKKEI